VARPPARSGGGGPSRSDGGGGCARRRGQCPLRHAPSFPRRATFPAARGRRGAGPSDASDGWVEAEWPEADAIIGNPPHRCRWGRMANLPTRARSFSEGRRGCGGWMPACRAVKSLTGIGVVRPSRLGRQATEHLRMRRWSAAMPVAKRTELRSCNSTSSSSPAFPRLGVPGRHRSAMRCDAPGMTGPPSRVRSRLRPSPS